MQSGSTVLRAAALGLFLIASPAAAHYAWDGELTAAQITATIAGNSLAGQFEGKDYTEYYDPDGTIHGQTAEGPYKGKWSVRDDDLMCFAYEPDYAIIGCVMLFLDADTVTFRLIDGTEEPPAKLLTGNPKGL
jgi:hypothetical protein